MSGGATEWQWADTDGTQHAIGLSDLKERLKTGKLPPKVLVWKLGWLRWLHAENVAELADALDEPGPARVPLADSSASQPPPPPVEVYDSVGIDRRKPFGPASTLPGAGPPPPQRRKPIPVRDVLPTLAEEPLPARSTLRPAGALPPPPRNVPSRSRVPSFDDVDRSSGSVSEPELGAQEEASGPSRSEQSTLPPAGSKARPVPRVAVLLAALIGVLTLVVIVLTLEQIFGQTEKVSIDSPEGASGTQAPGERGPCIIAAPAQRLAPEADVGTPPIFGNEPGGARFAIGFAARDRRAVGLLLDPATLSIDQPFADTSPAPIVGVVPLSAGGELRFAVDTQGAKLRDSRTIDHSSPFAVGVGEQGFVRQAPSGTVIIWPGQSEVPLITRPRVATVPGVGHALAFRHGGKQGKILVGWLEPDGRKKSELRAVKSSEPSVGTPSIATDGENVLVSYAAKPGGEPAFWQVRLARAAVPDFPLKPSRFSLPGGGPGNQAISPTTAALGRGRFLLQWTEGTSGNRVIRAQIIDVDLVPQNDPITLSPPGHNAGQGVLWARENRVVALYFVKKTNNHELWGVALKCR